VKERVKKVTDNFLKIKMNIETYNGLSSKNLVRVEKIIGDIKQKEAEALEERRQAEIERQKKLQGLIQLSYFEKLKKRIEESKNSNGGVSMPAT
jgi:predicted component of type VI protein secretion system